MIPLSRRHFLAIAGLAPVGGARAQLIGHAEGEWSIRGTDPIEIYRGDRRITAYHAGTTQGVPFFDPLVGPGGKSHTAPATQAPAEFAPTGLWFSLGNVNGRSFHPSADGPQEAGPERGIIVHKGMNGVLIKGSAVVIRVKSEWTETGSSDRRVCSDQREFTLFHREDGSLAVSALIELIADAGDLEIGPEVSGAWSVRVGPGLVWKEGDKNRHLSGSEGETGSGVAGSRSRWVVAEGLDAGNLPGGVAMFDHPGNPGAPARWTIDGSGLVSANPFVPAPLPQPPAPGTDAVEDAGNAARGFRMRARSGQFDVPRLVRNGESLFFRYRTIFFSGKAEAAGIPTAYDLFAGRSG